MDRLKHLFIVLLLSSFCNTFAQITTTADDNYKNSAALAETIFLHTNATTFVSGETLLYKLYCLKSDNLLPSTVSKIAYLQLIDSDKKIVFKHKLFLENGVAESDFFITPNLLSGSYKLIAYTNWMQNSTVKSYQMDLVIINPFQTDAERNATVDSFPDIKNTTSLITNNEIILALNKEIFLKREKITLSTKAISSDFQNGIYSISVRKKQNLPFVKPYTSVSFSRISKNSIMTDASSVVLPELRGELISGKISAKNPIISIANKYVALSIPGESFLFKTVKTKDDGSFLFAIDRKYKNTEFVFQILDANRLEYAITIDDKYNFDTTNVTFLPKFSLNENLKSSLQERSIASQIENAYFGKKSDSLAKITPIQPFYSSVGKEYILDNFTRFSSMEETITEILKEVHFEKRKKKYTLYLVDYDPNTDLKEKPLVLVDGLVLQDLNALFEYKTSNFYKVIVFNKGYFYQGKLYNGFVSFITKNYDYINAVKGDYLLQTTIQVPQPKKNYFQQVYNDATNTRIPDYRNQLLWNPNYTLENNSATLDFYTSDISGTFEIVLEGFSDSGNPVSITKYFEVK